MHEAPKRPCSSRFHIHRAQVRAVSAANTVRGAPASDLAGGGGELQTTFELFDIEIYDCERFHLL